MAAAVAAVALLAQVLLVRPRLTRRSNAVLAGDDGPRSRAHLGYVGFELVKVGALLIAGVCCSQRVRRSPDAPGPARTGHRQRCQPAVIDAVAASAERAGFATLWSGEHVVMVDESASRYPYADDGRIAVPAEADWIDPLIGLSFAAAATSTIRIATGVLLLPEHNPVLVAKQAATLDTLSGGRLTLGIGIGWSREEFDALGVPFERRGARTEEYVDAMRTFGATTSPRSTVTSSTSTLCGSIRNRCMTVAFRSCSAATATRRYAGSRHGAMVGTGSTLKASTRSPNASRYLHELCDEHGRDPAELRFAVALRDLEPGDAAALAALGIDELVLVEGPPEDAARPPTGWAHWLTAGSRSSSSAQ